MPYYGAGQGGSPTWPAWATGANSYYSNVGGGTGTTLAMATTNLLYANQLPPTPTAITISKMAIAVTATTATAGSKARMGIYQATAAGIPGTLVTDFGEVAIDSTGTMVATGSAVLQPGQTYFAAGVVSATGATINADTISRAAQFAPLNAIGSSVISGYTGSFTYTVGTALPGTFPTPSNNTNTPTPRFAASIN